VPLLPLRDPVSIGDCVFEFADGDATYSANADHVLVEPIHLAGAARMPLHVRAWLYSGEQYTGGSSLDVPCELVLKTDGAVPSSGSGYPGRRVALFPGAPGLVTEVCWPLPQYVGDGYTSGGSTEWQLVLRVPSSVQGTPAAFVHGGVFAGYQDPYVRTPLQDGLGWAADLATPSTNWARWFNLALSPGCKEVAARISNAGDQALSVYSYGALFDHAALASDAIANGSQIIPASSVGSLIIPAAGRWVSLGLKYGTAPTGSPRVEIAAREQ